MRNINCLLDYYKNIIYTKCNYIPFFDANGMTDFWMPDTDAYSRAYANMVHFPHVYRQYHIFDAINIKLNYKYVEKMTYKKYMINILKSILFYKIL